MRGPADDSWLVAILAPPARRERPLKSFAVDSILEQPAGFTYLTLSDRQRKGLQKVEIRLMQCELRMQRAAKTRELTVIID